MKGQKGGMDRRKMYPKQKKKTMTEIDIHTLCPAFGYGAVITFFNDLNLLQLGFKYPPLHKNPYPRVMKFTILADPSSVNITMHLACLFDAR